MRGVLYYSHDMGHTYTSTVYLLGNPVILWLVALAVAVACGVLAVYCRCRRFGVLKPEYAAFERWVPLFTALIFCLIAYALNLLPYVFVTRSCFVYHYLPALMYGELIAALLVDGLAGTRFMKIAFTASCWIIGISFLYFSPWLYAFRKFLTITIH